jgi:beta-galactosidase/beta-glucuronidase
VPGNWDVDPRYSTHKGPAWYQRDFTVPADWAPEARLRLCFDAVYHDAEVTLNGRVLGTHVGGYTPFEFDVTDLIRRDAPNVLTVRADNTYRRGAWWAWGGISRDVSLHANSEARIVYQHIRSEPDLAAGTARLFLTWRLANTSTRPLAVTLSPVLHSLGLVGAGETVAKPVATAGVVRATVPAQSTLDVTTRLDLAREQVSLWHFDLPHLYSVTTTLMSGERLLHARRDRFGIRQVALAADGLYLNGERIRVPGFNRVSDSNTTGNTEPDSLVRRDVDLMKEAGAVFSRLMHSPHAPNLQDYLDEKGLMIIAEIPVWGKDDPQVVAGNPLTKQWLAEMIARDYNHPSIIGWSTGNEIENHFDYVQSMNDYVRRELDPHRIVTYVSFTAARPAYNPTNDGVTHSDLAMINVYSTSPQAFSKHIRKVRADWPDKPVFMAEFGVAQIGVGDNARVPRFDQIWAAIGAEPYVIGGSLWTFNDYRSDYKGTPASGNREWGVVDVNRQPKGAFQEVRRAFAPAQSLTFDDRRIVLTPRAAGALPSYTLRGYRLEWINTASQRGTLALPDIAPGGEALELALPPDAGTVSEVRLVTPTGYAVIDGIRVL